MSYTATASVVLSAQCGTWGKDNVKSVSFNGEVVSFTCNNNQLYFNQLEILPGTNRIDLTYHTCAGMTSTEITLYSLMFLAVAFGIVMFFMGNDVTKIGTLIVFIVGVLIFVLIIAQNLSLTIC